MALNNPDLKQARYAAPELIIYGRAKFLTAAGSKGGSEGGAAMNDPTLMA